MIISLALMSPSGSSSLPVAQSATYLALHRVEFTSFPASSPERVVSYTAISPLPFDSSAKGRLTQGGILSVALVLTQELELGGLVDVINYPFYGVRTFLPSTLLPKAESLGAITRPH